MGVAVTVLVGLLSYSPCGYVVVSALLSPLCRRFLWCSVDRSCVIWESVTSPQPTKQDKLQHYDTPQSSSAFNSHMDSILSLIQRHDGHLPALICHQTSTPTTTRLLVLSYEWIRQTSRRLSEEQLNLFAKPVTFTV